MGEFGSDRRASDGRQSRCLSCYRIADAARRSTPHRKAYSAGYAARYRAAPGYADRKRVWQANYRRRHREKIQAYAQAWKPQRREYLRRRYRDDPGFRAALKLRQQRYQARRGPRQTRP